MTNRFINWLRPAPRPDVTKASATGPLLAFYSQGRPVWTPRDYAALAREGFPRRRGRAHRPHIPRPQAELNCRKYMQYM
jgi:hypothetical protein